MNQHIAIIDPPELGPPGAYAQGTAAGGLVFVAGQVGIDAGGAVVGPGDAGAQMDAALDRVAAVLARAGASLDDVTLVTVYLVRLEDFPAINMVWKARFGDRAPARATVRADLLLGELLVEVQATAVLPGGAAR